MVSANVICPLCKDIVDKLVYRFHHDSERSVIEKIKHEFPEWTVNDGACSRCVDFFNAEIVMEQRILPSIGPHFSIKTMDDFIVIPTGLRLNADPRYTGKGVTICFIDSGFYPHPDLVANQKRIKEYIDVNCGETGSKALSFGEGLGEVSKWHGTMTSVVCAGDGYLSNGLYKGIASDAELILLKVQNEEGRITTGNICKALEWVLENHTTYNIRIVNMSLSDDVNASYKKSEVDKLAELLIDNGIIIVAAAGNDENGVIKPPANSLGVIAVGGIDDENNLEEPATKLYHSTYGITQDGLMKPELVAHAIWIGAPILPGTKQQEESKALHYLLKQQDKNLRNELHKLFAKTELDDGVLSIDDASHLREIIIKRIQTCKYISPDYMHVDGTSFAAPIVSSVIAQLLEINPSLTPAQVRTILFSTAQRIEHVAAERQGFGAIQPRKALLKVLKRESIAKPGSSPNLNIQKNTIDFLVQSDCASQVSLAGSFNHWAQDVLLMEPCLDGLWKIEIPMLARGCYQYKFFVDEKIWIEDVENPYREPDGFAGFNSILKIEN
ncbi:MAG: S8 family serine peptidase [Ginsengibacter sp.]